MKNLKTAILLACGLVSFSSCKQEDLQPATVEEPSPPIASRQLAKEFPLLPLIEGPLWRRLQIAEASTTNPEATEQERTDAAAEAKRITNRLQEKHPFQQDDKRIILGGIVYDKKSHKIEIPVVVCYPKQGDDRHPGELELILCSVTGRSHETLFTSDLRPLHLELLMHLAGFRKSPPSSTFHVDIVIPHHDPIPIESLIQTAGDHPLESRLVWEFSGGEFNDPYLPDMTGDFLIAWHAHESVLRIRHDGIASGEMKLKAAAHPALKQHQAATLVLSPESSHAGSS